MNRYKDKTNLEDTSMEKMKGRKDINLDQKQPQYMKDSSSGGTSEMYYIEPNEALEPHNHNIKQTQGRSTTSSRSPVGVQRTAVPTVRTELVDKTETTRIVKQIPTLEVTIPRREPNKERSPMNINIGETAKEKEYNIQTLKAKRGLDQRDMLYNTFTNRSPIQEHNMNNMSFVNQRNQMDTFQLNDSRVTGQSPTSSSINVGRPQLLDSYQAKDSDESGLLNIKNQMEKNASPSPNQTGEIDSQMNQRPNMIQNENQLKSQIPRGETMSTNEVKRIVKNLTKVYDPHKGKGGALICSTQTYVPQNRNEDMFKDRYQVLQKMNKLSSILLSKNETFDPVREYQAEKKTFDRKTLARGTLGGGNSDSIKITKTPKQKFLFISLAMISSRGPNSEDRIILRKMRTDAGGVVDLAQEPGKTRTKYQIKKITRKKPPAGSNAQRTNPKYRDKAAKVVQGWWRDLRDRYKRVYNKIILIQSAWRGRWIRKYMYDIIYLSFLYQSFCQSIQKVLVNHVRPAVFDMFTIERKNAMSSLLKLFQQDEKYRLIKIRPYWEQWLSVLQKYKTRNYRSRNLVDIRRNGEEKLLILQKAFAKYRLTANLLKYINKSADQENQRRKFFGLIKLMQGGEKLAKKTGLYVAKPHIEKYLDNQLRQKAVRIILQQNPKMQRVLLKNYFNKWREQVHKAEMKEYKDLIFWTKVDNCHSKIGKNILRKYFARWHRLLPKNTDINFFSGSFVLQKAVWRKSFKDPLEALVKKGEYEATKDEMLRMLGVKSRHIRQHWGEYLRKWKDQAHKLKDLEFLNNVCTTLLSSILLRRKRRILSNRFAHWKKVPKIDMEEVFRKFRNMIAFTQKVVDMAIIPHEDHFLKSLSKKTNSRVYKLAAQRLYEKYMSNDRIWERYILNKWRNQCHKLEIYDFKLQLLKFSICKSNYKKQMNSLFRAWTKWKGEVANVKRDNIHQEGHELKERQLNKKFATKLLFNIKKNIVKGDNRNALQLAFKIYRNNINLLKEKESKDNAEALNHMKKYNIIINGPYLLDNLENKALNSKKTSALKSMQKKHGKWEKVNLLRYFLKWKGVTNDLIEKDNIDLIRRKMLKRYIVKLDKNKLNKAFNKWKIAGLGKRSNYPLIIGSDKLKQILLRPDWSKFKYIVNMRNLTIPEGMSLKNALILGKTNLGKSIALRNINMRPYFNRWKRKTEALENRDRRHQIFNKTIYPNIQKQSKLVLRRAFNQWKDKSDSLANNDLKKYFHMKLMSKMYSNGSKMGLRKYVMKWKENCRLYIRKLANANDACYKLRKAATIEPMNQFRKGIMYQIKYQKTQAKLLSALKSNDRGNLAYCFNKWKKRVDKQKELEFKYVFLKQVLKHQDIKSDEWKRNKLIAALLKWRVRSSPSHLYKQMININKGTERLSKAMRGPFNDEILNRLGHKADNKRQKSTLYLFIKKIDPKLDKRLLGRAFTRWKNKLSDTMFLREKFEKMVGNYFVSPSARTTLIQKPKQDLVEAMKAYDLMKKGKAKTIEEFCLGLLNIKRQMGLLKFSILLHKRIKELGFTNQSKFPTLFNRWIRNSRLIKINEDARTIQTFLKSCAPNRVNHHKQCEKGSDILKSYLLNRVLDRMNQSSKQNVLMQLQRKVFTNKTNTNKKSLKDRFNYWRNVIPQVKRLNAISLIQKNYRLHRSRVFLDRFRNRTTKIKYLTLKLLQDYNCIKRIAFAKWVYEAGKEKVKDNSIIIQDFLTKYYKVYKRKYAKEVLQNMFTIYYVMRIKDAMIAASKIRSDRGEVLYNTLENIFIRRPYQKLVNAMTWMSRIKKIKALQPKIAQSLRKYYIPYYMRIWKKNTVDVRDQKLIKIQNWCKARMARIRGKVQLRKNQLITKFLGKMTHDNDLLKALPFKLWGKKAQLSKLNDQAENIQKIWKGSTSRKNVERQLNKNRLRSLLRKGILGQLSNAIQDANDKYVMKLRNDIDKVIDNGIAKRYATNNLIDYANDELRNKYLFKLTGKKAFSDTLGKTRYAFDKWRNNLRKSNDAAKKLQSTLRAFFSKKKYNIIVKTNDSLLSIVSRYENNDKDSLRCALTKWNLRANYIKCNCNSRIIQDYLEPKLAKLLNMHFRNYFYNNALNLVKHRLNTGVKVNILKDAITRVGLGEFYNRLLNKTNQDKLRLFILKKFSHLDKEIAMLYLKKYFDNWKNNSNKKTDKLLKGVKVIQTNFKQLLAKRLLGKMKEKRARLLGMLMKLTKDHDLKLKAAFDLWRTKATAMKLDDASKILQSFLDDIAKKKKQREETKRIKRINDGFDKLSQLKFPLRIGLNQIRSESNRKILDSIINKLHNKRRDHLKTGYDVIREQQKNNLLNMIFKIPTKCGLRILRKWFDKWRGNAHSLSLLQFTKLIQKNYRLYSQNKRNSNLIERMKPIVNHLHDKHNNLLRHYFNNWKGTVKRMKVLKAVNKINDFTRNHLALTKAKKNWHRFSNGLNILNHNYAALAILGRLKKLIALQKMIKPIDNRFKRDGYDQFMNQLHFLRQMRLLRLIFNNFDKRREILSLNSYFNRWKDNTSKLAKRDIALGKAVNAMDNRYKCIATDTINSACLIKKLFKTIPKIRALEFFNRLAIIQEEKDKLKRLKDLLCQGKDNLTKTNKHDAIEKLYKTYIYHILNKMTGDINNALCRNKKPLFDKLMARMFLILSRATADSYVMKKKASNEPTQVPLSFKSRVTNPKNRIPNEKNDSDIYFRLTPYFVNYLNKKYDSNKQWGIDRLKNHMNDSKFCSLYKGHTTTTLFPLKREMYDAMKAKSDFSDSLAFHQIRLLKLFRRTIIKRLKTELIEPSHLYHLLYLIKISLMHKEIKEKRFGREVIRKWRFMSFVKKMAKKKLELMYQNLHMNYLQTTNLVFGESENVDVSIIKEFETLGDNMGMFINAPETQSYNLEKKTMNKSFSRQEMFDPDLLIKAKFDSDAQSKETIENKYVEINSEQIKSDLK